MRAGSVMLAAALAAGVGLWLAFGGAATDETPQSAAETPPASTGGEAAVHVLARVSRAQPVADRLVLRGLTEAARKVEVKAQTGGLVASPPLRKGTAVARGDLLCEVEGGEREAMLLEAQAVLAKAESDAQASQALSQRGFSSDKTVAADAAALETARAMVRRMTLDLERVRMTAPFDGVLESDTAEIGALLQPGDVCAVVLALDPIKTVAFAPERVVHRLSTDLAVETRLVTGERFAGALSFVSRAADAETRTFRVETTAPNPGRRIRDGMTAEMTLTLDAGMAHLLPASTLTLGPNGALGVRLADTGGAAPAAGADAAGVARFTPVEVLRDGAEGVWVRGLDDGAPVIVVGQDFVRDGAAIRVSFEATDAAAQPPAQIAAPGEIFGENSGESADESAGDAQPVK